MVAFEADDVGTALRRCETAIAEGLTVRTEELS
jgi:hypothetical protein